MANTTYHLGGYKPAAPAKNQAEQWDDATRTYTAWDAAGIQTSTRPYTAGENTAADAETAALTQTANGTSLRTQAETALDSHRTFLAIASPTNAQVAAQVKALTRVDIAEIRLILDKRDATD